MGEEMQITTRTRTGTRTGRTRPVTTALIAALVVVAGTLGACSGGTTSGSTAGAGDGNGAWPVTVRMDDNAGKKVEQTIPEEPRRVVVIGQNVAELMTYFGVQDRIVGAGYLDGADSYYKDALDTIPVITDQLPSTEAVMALKPDLIVSMSFAMTEEKLGTPETWGARGVPVVLVDNYTTGRDLDAYYGDIRNIGAAFGVSDRAEKYIAEEQQQLDEIRARFRDVSDRPRVLLVASGGTNKMSYTYYSPSLGLADEMVEIAGGEYVKTSDAVSAELSDEIIVKANPDIVIMTQFQKDETTKEKDRFLANPRLQKVDAVRNGRVMLVDYSTTVRGTPHLGELTEQLAAFIHGGDNAAGDNAGHGHTGDDQA